MHRDTVIGIVGVVILVAAMVGVFTYERSQAGDLDGGIGAGAANFTASLSGNAGIGEDNAYQEILNVNQSGLTNMTFTLTWTPGDTSVDTLRLIVAMPNNMTHESEEENDGQITLPIEIPAGTDSAGDWQVTVVFVDAQVDSPAGPLDPPVDPAGAADTSVDVTVEVSGSGTATA